MTAVNLTRLLDELDFGPREERQVRRLVTYRLDKTVKTYAKRKSKTIYHLHYTIKSDEHEVERRIDGKNLLSIKQEAYTDIMGIIIEELAPDVEDSGVIARIKTILKPYKNDINHYPQYVIDLGEWDTIRVGSTHVRNPVLFAILQELIRSKI